MAKKAVSGNAGKVDFAKACANAEKAWEKTKGAEIPERGYAGDKPIEKGSYPAKLLKASCGVGKDSKKPYVSFRVTINDEGQDWHGNTYSIFHTVDNEPTRGGESNNLLDLCDTLRKLGYDTKQIKNLGASLPQLCEELNKDKPDLEVYCSPREATGDKEYKVYCSINKVL